MGHPLDIPRQGSILPPSPVTFEKSPFRVLHVTRGFESHWVLFYITREALRASTITHYTLHIARRALRALVFTLYTLHVTHGRFAPV